MQKIVVGILAHVDAGKTTLSEALLFESGMIRKRGRVDNGDAFLDTYEMERNRGITVFSKQAVLKLTDREITLLDTPGHVDFSAEMERTLQVLDYAVLVISGADGVQGHTRTLWRLLGRYHIPVFVFINKMDQPGTEREKLLKELKESLSENCVDFTQSGESLFQEEAAMCSETALEQFLETGSVEISLLREIIKKRQIYPCFFGSALKMDGVKEFLEGVEQYTESSFSDTEFGARVFKIARDSQGNRLTYMKITGGILKARESLRGKWRNPSGEWEEWEEKVNQIRIYSGEKFETAREVTAGSVCAVTGLEKTRPGDGFGSCQAEMLPSLEPVLNYRIILPPECDAAVMLPKLREIEEEEPQLQIEWNETLQEIHAKVMGEVQLEILQGMIWERFKVNVTFGEGKIVYKETIADVAEGVGHFEPLRHYAEAHFILEPLERGSGLQFETAVSEDELEKNWQRLIRTHLEEKQHKGVLAGADITDMKITLVAGRAHQKHTEGGDFREATYRGVRQGLMQATSLLLEPYYEFRIELPERYIGRAMTDVQRLQGKCELVSNEEGRAVLSGRGPVQTFSNYQKEVTAYTGGEGHFFGEPGGYEPCHNTEEVLAQIQYDCESDMRNPSASVFCAHGAGFIVPWDEVYDYMHLEKRLGMRGTKWEKYGENRLHKGEQQDDKDRTGRRYGRTAVSGGEKEELFIGTEEIDEILNRTYHANQKQDGDGNKWAKRRGTREAREVFSTVQNARTMPAVKRPEYLLVDGYNVIFAWDDLKELAEVTLDGARGKLMDILCNYQAVKKCELIVVFDAYRLQGHETEVSDYHNIHVVFTKEAETADRYIEKFAHENGRKYDVTVATSDGLEQIIIRGQGCRLLSARELQEEIRRMESVLRQDYLQNSKGGKNLLGEYMPKTESVNVSSNRME